jgi:hypothetical protein
MIHNPELRYYKNLRTQEMDFPIDLELIETDDSFCPFGAKSVAESGLVPTVPASLTHPPPQLSQGQRPSRGRGIFLMILSVHRP